MQIHLVIQQFLIAVNQICCWAQLQESADLLVQPLDLVQDPLETLVPLGEFLDLLGQDLQLLLSQSVLVHGKKSLLLGLLTNLCPVFTDEHVDHILVPEPFGVRVDELVWELNFLVWVLPRCLTRSFLVGADLNSRFGLCYYLLLLFLLFMPWFADRLDFELRFLGF